MGSSLFSFSKIFFSFFYFMEGFLESWVVSENHIRFTKIRERKCRARLRCTLCVIFLRHRLCKLLIKFKTTLFILGSLKYLSRTAPKLHSTFEDYFRAIMFISISVHESLILKGHLRTNLLSFLSHHLWETTQFRCS